MNMPHGNKFNADALLGLFDVAWVYRRLMVLLFALGLAGGLSYFTYSRTVYYSRSLVHVIRVERQLDDRTLPAKAVFIDSNDAALLQEFGSDEVLQRTARRLRVSNPSAVGLYLKKFRVEYNTSGDIVVDAWFYSQPLAQRWTAVMVSEYLLYRAEKRQEARKVSVQSLTKEASQIQKIVAEALNVQVELKETNNMSRLLIEVQQLNDIPRELLEVNRRLVLMAKARGILSNTNQDAVARLSLVAFVESSSPSMRRLQLIPGQTLPAGTGAETNNATVVVPSMLAPANAPWEELDRERRRLLGQVRQLDTMYGTAHPKIVDLHKQIERVNRALDLEVEVVVQRFELQYANLKERRAELEARLPEVQAATRQYERNLQEIKRINTTSSVWDTIQEQIARMVDSLDFWSDKQRVELQFMGQLESPDRPVAPDQFKIAIGSVALGVALALSMPFLLRALDTRMVDMADAERELSLDALGLIPEHEQITRNVAHDPRQEGRFVDENFRMLRTNLMLRSQASTVPQVVLIASPLPGEGKTTVAAHIAESFAEKGESTLIIDADLYRGCLHRYFKVPSGPGFSEAIQGLRKSGETTVSVGKNLDLMPSGDRKSFSPDLIDSPRFLEVMRDLRSRYAHIIIDSPPILGLSEVNLFARQVDGIVIVISCRSTPRRIARDAVELLKANGAKIYGFVLNRANFSSLQYRYRYYYYSKDYYAKYTETDPQRLPPPKLPHHMS